MLVNQKTKNLAMFFAVWSMVRAVYFYDTLLWHTNWPNVFLWRINYWLSDGWMWGNNMLEGVWSADAQSQQVFVLTTIRSIRHLESGFLFFLFWIEKFYCYLRKYPMRYDAQTWESTFKKYYSIINLGNIWRRN